MPSEGGAGEPASILVTISPARATLVTGQKLTLTAITDDRFGVTWSVSPPARAIAPSSSYNQATVIFTAPQKPGIYTAIATSMTNPTQSRSVTIAVTNPWLPSSRMARGIKSAGGGEAARGGRRRPALAGLPDSSWAQPRAQGAAGAGLRGQSKSNR